jgi:threonine dehydratase
MGTENGCSALIVLLVLKMFVLLWVQDMFEENRNILEPAGALALAGAEAYCKYYGLKGETVVAISSGANMNFDRLRLVTELADVGRKREAVLATFLPEEQGSFKKFAELVCIMIFLSTHKFIFYSFSYDFLFCRLVG